MVIDLRTTIWEHPCTPADCKSISGKPHAHYIPPLYYALLGILPLQGAARAQDRQDVAQPKVVVGLARQLLLAQEVERVKLAGKRGILLESAGGELDLCVGGETGNAVSWVSQSLYTSAYASLIEHYYLCKNAHKE